MRNGKGKTSHSKSDSYHGGKKKDMSKVKCFDCHELGHFATNYPLKKSKKNSLGGMASEALTSQFELEFTLITCMVSSMMDSVWYLEDKALFTDLEEKDLQMHIDMGDDERYSSTRLSMVRLSP